MSGNWPHPTSPRWKSGAHSHQRRAARHGAPIGPALRGPVWAPAAGLGWSCRCSPEAYAAHLAAHASGCRVAAARPGWSVDQLAMR